MSAQSDQYARARALLDAVTDGAIDRAELSRRLARSVCNNLCSFPHEAIELMLEASAALSKLRSSGPYNTKDSQ